MKIGDKTTIPFGSRQDEAAFVRNIKGNNIWLCLESNPGAQAVLFHLTDFSSSIIIDHLNTGLDSKEVSGCDTPDQNAKFWMIWNPLGKAPVHMHNHYANAIEEAKRLAEKEIGYVFFVLEAVNAVKQKVTVITDVTDI